MTKNEVQEVSEENTNPDGFIPNWGVFGNRIVLIEAHEFIDGDDTLFEAALTFILDDGEEEVKPNIQDNVGITIFTGTYDKSPEALIKNISIPLATVFERISELVYIIDIDGNSTERSLLEIHSTKRVGNSVFAN